MDDARYDYCTHLSNRKTENIAVTPDQICLMIDAMHDVTEFLLSSKELRDAVFTEDPTWKEIFKDEFQIDELLDAVHRFMYLSVSINDNNRYTQWQDNTSNAT